MAEGQRMTAADVVAQVRDGRLEDFVREAVVLVARELMEAEISTEIGAELGEVAPETRVTHCNGYRPRAWETRVGEIELLIPRKRQGSYFPSFLEPRRRSEQAIVAVVLEVCQRREHPEGRSPRRAAGDRGNDQGPRERDLPGVG
jgi:putative transposase